MLKRQVHELSQPDPMAPSAEDVALANAREAIEQASALAELMNNERSEVSAETPDPEARACAELERLKAARASEKAYLKSLSCGPDTAECGTASVRL